MVPDDDDEDIKHPPQTNKQASNLSVDQDLPGGGCHLMLRRETGERSKNLNQEIIKIWEVSNNLSLCCETGLPKFSNLTHCTSCLPFTSTSPLTRAWCSRTVRILMVIYIYGNSFLPPRVATPTLKNQRGYVLILIYHLEYVHIFILKYLKTSHMKILQKNPYFYFFNNNHILIHINEYVHILHQNLLYRGMYHHIWPGMIAYSVYILDTFKILRYIGGCSYTRE